jgi:hypothetical protein
MNVAEQVKEITVAIRDVTEFAAAMTSFLKLGAVDLASGLTLAKFHKAVLAESPRQVSDQCVMWLIIKVPGYRWPTHVEKSHDAVIRSNIKFGHIVRAAITTFVPVDMYKEVQPWVIKYLLGASTEDGRAATLAAALIRANVQWPRAALGAVVNSVIADATSKPGETKHVVIGAMVDKFATSDEGVPTIVDCMAVLCNGVCKEQPVDLYMVVKYIDVALARVIFGHKLAGIMAAERQKYAAGGSDRYVAPQLSMVKISKMAFGDKVSKEIPIAIPPSESHSKSFPEKYGSDLYASPYGTYNYNMFNESSYLTWKY